MRKLKVGGIYQHYKDETHLYKVKGVAKHSEDLTDYVIYQPLYDNKLSKLWIRPKEMFLENVEKDGKTSPRFKLVKDK